VRAQEKLETDGSVMDTDKNKNNRTEETGLTTSEFDVSICVAVSMWVSVFRCLCFVVALPKAGKMTARTMSQGVKGGQGARGSNSTFIHICSSMPLIMQGALFVFSMFVFVLGCAESSSAHPTSSSPALRDSGAWGRIGMALGRNTHHALSVQSTGGASLSVLRIRGGQTTSSVFRPVGPRSGPSKALHDRELLKTQKARLQIERPTLINEDLGGGERGRGAERQKPTPMLSLVNPAAKGGEIHGEAKPVENAKKFEAFQGTGHVMLTAEQVCGCVCVCGVWRGGVFVCVRLAAKCWLCWEWLGGMEGREDGEGQVHVCVCVCVCMYVRVRVRASACVVG